MSKKQRIEEEITPQKGTGDDSPECLQDISAVVVSMSTLAYNEALVPSLSPALDDKQDLYNDTVSQSAFMDSNALVPSPSCVFEMQVRTEDMSAMPSPKLLPSSPMQQTAAEAEETTILEHTKQSDSDSDNDAVVPLCSNTSRGYRQDRDDCDNDRVCPLIAGRSPDKNLDLPAMGLLHEEVMCRTPTKSAASSAMTATLTTQTATPSPHNSDAQLVPPSPVLSSCPALLTSEDITDCLYTHPSDRSKTHQTSFEGCNRAMIPEVFTEGLEYQSGLVESHVPMWTRSFPTGQIGIYVC